MTLVAGQPYRRNQNKSLNPRLGSSSSNPVKGIIDDALKRIFRPRERVQQQHDRLSEFRND